MLFLRVTRHRTLEGFLKVKGDKTQGWREAVQGPRGRSLGEGSRAESAGLADFKLYLKTPRMEGRVWNDAKLPEYLQFSCPLAAWMTRPMSVP